MHKGNHKQIENAETQQCQEIQNQKWQKRNTITKTKKHTQQVKDKVLEKFGEVSYA